VPSPFQPTKSPPTVVSRRVGTDRGPGQETVGAAPPTGGTVIMYTLRFARTSAREPSGESSTSSGRRRRAARAPGTGAVTLHDRAHVRAVEAHGQQAVAARPHVDALGVRPDVRRVAALLGRARADPGDARRSPPVGGQPDVLELRVAPCRPKSSSVRMRCCGEPRTAIRRCRRASTRACRRTRTVASAAPGRRCRPRARVDVATDRVVPRHVRDPAAVRRPDGRVLDVAAISQAHGVADQGCCAAACTVARSARPAARLGQVRDPEPVERREHDAPPVRRRPGATDLRDVSVESLIG
jgi:hypothetical protein